LAGRVVVGEATAVGVVTVDQKTEDAELSSFWAEAIIIEAAATRAAVKVRETIVMEWLGDVCVQRTEEEESAMGWTDYTSDSYRLQ
jgi:hypothetical protein